MLFSFINLVCNWVLRVSEDQRRLFNFAVIMVVITRNKEL